MYRRTVTNGWVALTLLPLVFGAACTTSKSEAPSLSGPSELGLSLAITATPDVLTKDGTSQATIAIVARNENSQPVGGLSIRLDMAVGGTLQDYGRLSAKSVTTGADGRASVTYTAPSGPSSGNSQDDESVLHVLATPVGSNFSNSVARDVTIRLMPSGVIVPPAGHPVARFTYAPSTPGEGTDVAFDGSTSVNCSAGTATVEACLATGSRSGLTYAWDFGDGTTAVGAQASHAYSEIGAYSVSLTVTNDRGVTDRTSQFVNIAATAGPTANFSLSPNNPNVGQSVFFNANASTAAAGHTIVSYDWTFGDGGTASGATVVHSYDSLGTWSVTLTVTDDLGHTGTVSQSIAMADAVAPAAIAGPRP